MPRGQGAPAGLSSIEVDSGGWSVSPPGVAARVRTRTAAAGDGVSDVVEWLAHHRDDVQTCQACPEVLQITEVIRSRCGPCENALGAAVSHQAGV